MIFKFELGDKVRDVLTGFEGHIEARIECLNGCIQYLIQPKIDKEGKIPDACQIDEQQLKLIGKSPLKKEVKKETNGGLRSFSSKYEKKI